MSEETTWGPHCHPLLFAPHLDGTLFPMGMSDCLWCGKPWSWQTWLDDNDCPGLIILANNDGGQMVAELDELEGMAIDLLQERSAAVMDGPDADALLPPDGA